MSKLYERCLKWWNSYRYRFFPWIIYSWRSRSVRHVDRGVTDLSDDQVEGCLLQLLTAFKCSAIAGKVNEFRNGKSVAEQYFQSKNISWAKTESPQMSSDFNNQNKDNRPINKNLLTEYILHQKNLEILQKQFGFTVERRPSTIEGAGTGVFVASGSIPQNTVASLYPGVVYNHGEPLLLQSFGNAFIFRCIDGIHIDGSDRGISRIVFKSSSHRDKIGLQFISDMSWMTPYPINPLAIGQYVNNGSTGNPANVTYQEVDISENFPFDLRQFIPNINFSSSLDGISFNRTRTVALVSLRQIEAGEELFSSYYTVVLR